MDSVRGWGRGGGGRYGDKIVSYIVTKYYIVTDFNCSLVAAMVYNTTTHKI